MPKQTRTRTGCLCCRRRHKKCDEMKPACQFCISKGLQCECPIKGTVFVTYNQKEKEKSITTTAPTSPRQSSFKQYQPILKVSSQTTKDTTQQKQQIEVSIPSPPASDSSESSESPDSQDQSLDSFNNQKFLNYSFAPLKTPIFTNEPLPSIKQYHFVIPRDHYSSTNSDINQNLSTKRLSVNSLLN